MDIRKEHKTTAIATMAVVFISLLAVGCCTKRDITDLKGQLAEIEAQSNDTQRLVARMDSIITAGGESNRRLQNDVRSSTDELTRQMSQLLENYHELMARMEQMSQQKVITLPPKSSPGAQTDPLSGGAVDEPASRQQAADCVDTYDNAFTLTRRGEYEAAIEGFRKFLSNCATHADIENAYYWLGECYYAQDKYSQAISEYDLLVRTYPDSPNMGRAIYKLARCKQETGKTTEARELFQRLVDEHTGTLEAQQAAERLKDL